MKKNLTEMAFILDMSGSMSHITDDTIGGFNSIIEKQKCEDGEAYVTTVLFDHEYKLLHDHIPLEDVKQMTRDEYSPRGTTALFDAIGKTINSIGARLNNTPEDERPEKIIVVITTDGYENASREFTRNQIKEMIEHQQSKYSWTFMFLGANIDATAEAESIGIGADWSRNYATSAQGVAAHAEGVSTAMCYLRSSEYVCNADNSSYKAVMAALDSVTEAVM